MAAAASGRARYRRPSRRARTRTRPAPRPGRVRRGRGEPPGPQRRRQRRAGGAGCPPVVGDLHRLPGQLGHRTSAALVRRQRAGRPGVQLPADGGQQVGVHGLLDQRVPEQVPVADGSPAAGAPPPRAARRASSRRVGDRGQQLVRHAAAQYRRGCSTPSARPRAAGPPGSAATSRTVRPAPRPRPAPAASSSSVKNGLPAARATIRSTIAAGGATPVIARSWAVTPSRSSGRSTSRSACGARASSRHQLGDRAGRVQLLGAHGGQQQDPVPAQHPGQVGQQVPG